MFRYIVRRSLYMVPTVVGVIIVTFLLFNVVGGDPAVMKFGKNTSPKALEDFDALRGYNKPLLLGMWGKTRAYAAPDFRHTAGEWRFVEGASVANQPEGFLSLGEGRSYTIPMAFPPDALETYQWVVKYRLPVGAARLVVHDGAREQAALELQAGGGWQRAHLAFEAPEEVGDVVCAFEVEAGELGIGSLRLQRRVAHILDSQFLFYLKQLVHLDFGTSHETNQRVSRMILDGILPSLSLTVPMFFSGLLISISLSLMCAFFRNTFIDRFFVVLSVVLMSVNYLVWIVLGQFTLGYVVRWFPVWGFESWRYLVLPCIIGVATGLGSNIRFYRTVMLDEMYRDYVRTAFAKGVGRRRVLFKHVLKNAMIPILTSVVMAIPFLYTGSLLLETFFGIPGLGRMGINAIYNSDVDVIRALVFVGAMIYVVANLVTDICYAVVDPRVKLQ